MKTFLREIFFICCSFYFVSATFDTVSLVDNSYQGVVIAINPEIAESTTLLNSIKAAWIEASAALYAATRKRAYFGNITILVPKSWNGTYERAFDETYDAADVVVTNTNRVRGNIPYVLQPGGCGEPGTKIFTTRDYYTNDTYVESFGQRGKVMVHEWSHYRWGVFDEIASGDYAPFYISSTGTIEATRCSLGIHGENMIVQHNEIVQDVCNYDPQTLLPNSTDCKFILAWDQDLDLKASIMSYQYVHEINGFCDDNDNDPLNRHNREAPNEHNDKCNKRSVWDVITSSVDFTGGRNLANPNVPSTIPTFRVVKPFPYRSFVLVLDVSGSMEGGRLIKMRQIMNTFVDDFVQRGDYVGITIFSTIARISSPLVKIRDQSDRASLIRHIPRSVRGWTCIGCGINSAVRIMEQHSPDLCGDIIVFTDGGENVKPSVANVRDKVVKKKCRVSAVFFTTTANQALVRLVDATSGTWFYGDTDDITPLIGAYNQLSQSKDGDVIQQANMIHSTSRVIEAGQSFTTDVEMDATIGILTVFSFTWSDGDVSPGILITSPSGCSYSTNDVNSPNPCPGHPLANVKSAFKTVKFTIPGTAQVGKWRYRVTTASLQTVSVTVTSKSRGKKPIIVSVNTIPGKQGVPMKIFARVTIDDVPLIGANVRAVIKYPNTTKQTLPLFDEGANPDTTRNDGTYSRFFLSSAAGGGRYSLQVLASGKPGENKSKHINFGKPAAYKIGYVYQNGSVVLNKNKEDEGATDETIETETIGDFSRVVVGQSFEYTGPKVDRDIDQQPPSKVTDLKLKQTIASDVTSPLSLTFTAPGDDFDSGTTSSYELRYTLSNPQNLLTSFESQLEVNETGFVRNQTVSPKPAGSQESILIKPPTISNTANFTSVSYSIRGIDDAGNRGPPSNVATVNLLKIKPVVPTLIPRTTPPPTTPATVRNMALCRAMYSRAYRATFRFVCPRPRMTKDCGVAANAFYWTEETYNVDCGSVNALRACRSAYTNACRSRWCRTCRRENPWRSGLYNEGRRFRPHY
ncbi:calcium-activated chloride channel regulator 3A-1-like [Ciona intestinalis]